MPHKLLLFVLGILLNIVVFAQKELPIIHANNEITRLYEGHHNGYINWYLTPEAKPDIYYLDKSKKASKVTLRTDIDEIKVKLRPGESFDFVVVLNGKDSCYNRFIHKAPNTFYQDLSPLTKDTIPFRLTQYSNIIIEALLNEQDTLYLNFDTGASGIRLKEDVIVEKTHLLADQDTETPNFRAMSRQNTLKMGNLTWDSMPVATTRFSAHESDGRFGWDLFDGRVVEIDYEKSILIVHSRLPKLEKAYKDFDIIFDHTLFHVKGDLVLNGKKYKSRFLVDSGYQKAILLDSVLMQQYNFPTDLPIIKTNELRDGIGNVFITKIVETDALSFGKLTLENIPTQLLNRANPAGYPTHFLGAEVLKRFNTVLDFQDNKMYLKPNQLEKDEYSDAS